MVEVLVDDQIAKKFDEEWTPHVVREPEIDIVRSWLKEQDEEDIRLYLSTFQETLDDKHRARAALLREELKRRADPPPDRVKELIAVLRRNRIVAAFVVFGIVVSGLAGLRESLCELAPSWCVMNDRPVTSKPITWGEEQLDFGG